MSTTKTYQTGDRPVPGYVLVEPLGRGGMGVVWLARSAGGVDVAMKVIDGLGQNAGLEEFHGLQVVKNIKHANLCPIVGFWLKDADGNILDDSDHAAVSDEIGWAGEQVSPTALKETDRDSDEKTERDPGRASLRGTLLPDPLRESTGARAAQLIIAMGLGHASLAERLTEVRAEGLDGIPVDTLLDYLTPSAKAIDLLNSDYSIQHCDVKPGNILLVGDAPQVCDFGLAKQLSAHRGAARAGFTVAYAPPELTDGKDPTPTTDQYSLAVTYYELRTGRLPYVEETYTAVMDAKNSGQLDFSAVGVRERKVLVKATSVDPAMRYASCADMMGALARAVHYVDQYRALKVLAGIVVLLIAGGGIAFAVQPQMFHDLVARLSGTGPGAADLDEEQVNQILTIANERFAEEKWEEAFDTLDNILVSLPDHPGAIAARAEFFNKVLAAADASLVSDPSGAMAQFDQAAKEAREAEAATRTAAKLGWVRGTLRSPAPDWDQSAARLTELRDVEALSDAQKLLIAQLDVLVATRGTAARVFDPQIIAQLAALAENPAGAADSWEARKIDELKFKALAAVETGEIEVKDQNPLHDVIWPGGLELAFLLRSIENGLSAETPDHAAIGAGMGRAEVLAGGKSESVTRRVAGLSRAVRASELVATLRAGNEPLDAVLAELARLGTERPPIVPGERILDALDRYVNRQLDREVLAPEQAQRLRDATEPAATWAEASAAARWRQRLARLTLLAGVVDPQLDLATAAAPIAQALAAVPAADTSVETTVLRALHAESRLAADPGAWSEVSAGSESWKLEAPAYQPYLAYVRTLIERSKPLARVSDSMAQRIVELVAVPPLPAFLNHDRRRDFAAGVLTEAAEAHLRADLNDLSLPATPPEIADTVHVYLEALPRVARQLPATYDRLWTQAVYYGTRSARRVDEAIEATSRLLANDAAAVPARIMYIRAMVLRDRDGQDSWLEPLGRAVDIWVGANAPGPKEVMERILVPALETVESSPPANDAAKRRAVALLYARAAQLVRQDVGVEDLIRARGDDPFAVLKEWFTKANQFSPEPVPEYLLGEAWGTLLIAPSAPVEVLDRCIQLATEARRLLPPMGPRVVRLASASESIRGLSLIRKSRYQSDDQVRVGMLRDAVAAYQFAADPRNQGDPDYAEFLKGLSAAYLEMAFFGCGEHKWMNLTNAVRFAEKAKDHPEHRRREDVYLFLGNAYEDQAMYLNEDTYELSIAAFDESRRIALRENHPLPEAKARFYLGRARFRRIENGYSADPTGELQLAFDDLQAAERVIDDPGLKAEIPIWISKIYSRQAGDTVDPAAAEQLHEMAAASLKRGIEIAAANADQYWPRYQAELVKHYLARRDLEAGKAAASEIVAAAKADDFGSRVSAQFVLEAMAPYYQSATSYDDIVATVNEFLGYIPRTDSVNSRSRAEVYLVRARAIVETDSPREFWDMAADDATQVLDLAADVHCEFDRLNLIYRAQAVIGTIGWKRHSDEFAGKVTPANAATAKASARRVVDSLLAAIESLDRRHAVATQALQEDLANEQLSDVEQSNRRKYAERIRDSDLAMSLDVRDRLAKMALSLCRDFDLPPDEVKALAQRVYDVTSEMSDRHVGTNSNRRRMWQELQAERRMLDTLRMP